VRVDVVRAGGIRQEELQYVRDRRGKIRLAKTNRAIDLIADYIKDTSAQPWGEIKPQTVKSAIEPGKLYWAQVAQVEPDQPPLVLAISAELQPLKRRRDLYMMMIKLGFLPPENDEDIVLDAGKPKLRPGKANSKVLARKGKSNKGKPRGGRNLVPQSPTLDIVGAESSSQNSIASAKDYPLPIRVGACVTYKKEGAGIVADVGGSAATVDFENGRRKHVLVSSLALVSGTAVPKPANDSGQHASRSRHR
jgi:hypothetical protein